MRVISGGGDHCMRVISGGGDHCMRVMVMVMVITEGEGDGISGDGDHCMRVMGQGNG